jgi:hypothetical protein
MKYFLAITFAAAAIIVLFSLVDIMSGPTAPSNFSTGYEQGLVWGKSNPILSPLFFLSLLVLALFTYLLPSIIAGFRHHRNIGALAVINFLLGWTFIAWVGCLAWACSADVNKNATEP